MSGGGTPYIGSKISLISKAKIRYEGYLYTIDTEESTVTLAKVKSFGTEDRNAPNRFPERNEIYEYIVFRGSDIDDLHVAECPTGSSRSQVQEDPAIVQTGNTQPSLYQQQMQMRLGTPMAPQSYGPFGGMPPYGYPMGFRPQGNMPLSSVIGQGGLADRSQRSSSFDQFRRSPSPPSAGVVGHRYHGKEKEERRSKSPDGERPVQRQGDGGQKPYDSQSGGGKPQREHRSNQRQKDSDYERGGEKSGPRKHSRDNDQQRHSYRDHENAKEQTRGKEKDFPKEKGKESSRGPKKQYDTGESHGSKGDSSKIRPDGKEKERSRKTENEGHKKGGASGELSHDSKKDNQKETNREGHEGGRGQQRGRGRGRVRGRGSNNKARFDKDFDFERANAKFNKEEVEKELLSALKKKASLKDDDDVIVEKECHDDSHDDVGDVEVNGDDVYYDKSKSFFDQISCDAGGPMTDGFSKRKERALNVETFGFIPRNYRGRPYRGRGGRGSRGRGGYGRGGQGGRTGRGGNRTWVDYDFDFEAAGIRQGSSSKSGGS